MSHPATALKACFNLVSTDEITRFNLSYRVTFTLGLRLVGMTLLTRGGGDAAVAAFLVCALLVYDIMIYVSEGANDFFPMFSVVSSPIGVFSLHFKLCPHVLSLSEKSISMSLAWPYRFYRY